MGSFLPQVKCGTTDTTGLACSTGRKDEDGVRITPDSRWPGETLSLPTRPKTPLAQGGRAGTRRHQNRRFWQEKFPLGRAVLPCNMGAGERKGGASWQSKSQEVCLCSHAKEFFSPPQPETLGGHTQGNSSTHQVEPAGTLGTWAAQIAQINQNSTTKSLKMLSLNGMTDW